MVSAAAAEPTPTASSYRAARSKHEDSKWTGGGCAECGREDARNGGQFRGDDEGVVSVCDCRGRFRGNPTGQAGEALLASVPRRYETWWRKIDRGARMVLLLWAEVRHAEGLDVGVEIGRGGGGAVRTSHGQAGHMAVHGRGRAQDVDAHGEEEQEAERVGPDVDGVVVQGEEGGDENGAQRMVRRAVTAVQEVVVPHPRRQLQNGQQAPRGLGVGAREGHWRRVRRAGALRKMHRGGGGGGRGAHARG
ncbi:adiponectin receptor-like protein [Gracilaria domingensis]|nr:adiponectin receptor-like protein [Gracilaria domingensis]